MSFLSFRSSRSGHFQPGCDRQSLSYDRESSFTERIVAALLIIKGFVFVVKFILPGCYLKSAQLYWVVPSGCSRCALLQSFPCHLLVRTRHEQRPKGEAAKQRASEQPVFTNLSLDRTCMKIWCSLNRNPADRCRESCALWSSFPLADVSKIFLGILLHGLMG